MTTVARLPSKLKCFQHRVTLRPPHRNPRNIAIGQLWVRLAGDLGREHRVLKKNRRDRERLLLRSRALDIRRCDPEPPNGTRPSDAQTGCRSTGMPNGGTTHSDSLKRGTRLGHHRAYLRPRRGPLSHGCSNRRACDPHSRDRHLSCVPARQRIRRNWVSMSWWTRGFWRRRRCRKRRQAGSSDLYAGAG